MSALFSQQFVLKNNMKMKTRKCTRLISKELLSYNMRTHEQNFFFVIINFHITTFQIFPHFPTSTENITVYRTSSNARLAFWYQNLQFPLQYWKGLNILMLQWVIYCAFTKTPEQINQNHTTEWIQSFVNGCHALL
jgi:hypothetical protein